MNLPTIIWNLVQICIGIYIEKKIQRDIGIPLIHVSIPKLNNHTLKKQK